MEQQTNVQMINDPKDIVENNDVVDTKKTVEQVETKPSETETDKVFRKVKYNGKETDVLEKDIEPLLQKGLNYDHIQSELKTLRDMGFTKAEADELKALAGETPIKDYVKTLKEKEFNEKLNARASALKQEDASLSDAAALRIAQLELKQSIPTKPKEEVELENGFKELAKIFPETQNYQNLADFPKEFVDSIKEGTNILKAYTDYYVAEQKRQLEIERQNIENKVKSEGQLGGGTPPKQDPLGEALKKAILGK